MKKLKKLLAMMLVVAMAMAGLPAMVNAAGSWYDLEAEDGVVAKGAPYIETAASGDTYIFMNTAAHEQKSTMTVDVAQDTYDVWALIGIDNGSDTNSGNGFAGSYPRLCSYKFYWDDNADPFKTVHSVLNAVEEWNPLYTTVFLNGTIANGMHWVQIAEDVALSGEKTIVAEIASVGNRNGAIDKIRLVPSDWNHTPTDTTTEPVAPDGGEDEEAGGPDEEEPIDTPWFDLEAENGTLRKNAVLENAAAYGGKYMVSNQINNNNASTMSFSLENQETYDIWALIAVKAANYLCEYEFTLDGSNKFYDKNMSVANSEATSEGLYTTGYLVGTHTADMKWVKVGSAITIGTGSHTLLADVEKEHASNENSVIYGGNSYGAIDVVRFVPTSWNWVQDGTDEPEEPTEEIEPEDWYDLEAEAGTYTNATTATVGDNTYVYDVKTSAASDASITVECNAKEGTYDIWALIALDTITQTSWMRFGQYGFYLNGAEDAFGTKANNKNDVDWTDGGFYTVTTPSFASYPLYMHWAKVGSAVALDGETSITTKFERTTVHTWCAIDKIRVVPTSWNHTPTDIATPPSEPVDVDVTGFEIEEATLDMEVGDNYTLTYEVTPADATDKSIEWVSSDANVVLVSNGNLVASAPGTATITGTTTDGGFTDTCVVTVAGEDTEPGETPDWLDLEAENGINDTSNTATVEGNTYIWVENAGDNSHSTVIFDAKEGTYDIWALVGLQDSHNSYPVYGWYRFYLNGSDTAFGEKAANNLGVEWIDGGLYTTRTFVNHQPTYMHWVKIGSAIEIAEGTNTITTDFVKGVHQCCALDKIRMVPTEWEYVPTDIATPPAPPQPVEEINIIETSLEMHGGNTFELTYEVLPVNATLRDIVWSSSNPTVASVANGVVTAISGGTATISARNTAGTAIDTCEVTVLAPTVDSAIIKIAEVTNTNQPGVGKNNGIVQLGAPQAEGTVYTFDIPFTAPAEGTYEIYFTGSENGVSHASKYADYKFDGVSKGKLTEQSHYAKYGYANKADSTLGIFWYKLTEMDLDTNEHTITFVFDSPRSLGGGYFFGLEYLLLVPKGKGLKLGSSSGAENLGEVLLSCVDIDVTETTEDLLIHKNAIDGTEIVWTSSHPEIIDEDGYVTQPGYYEEDTVVTMTASVTITKAGATVTSQKDFEIKVPKKGEYSVENLGIVNDSSGYTARAKVSENTGADGKTAVLAIARYNADGAMVDIGTSVITLTGELQSISASISDDFVAAGDTIEAFLWTDMGTKKLINNSIVTY